MLNLEDFHQILVHLDVRFRDPLSTSSNGSLILFEALTLKDEQIEGGFEALTTRLTGWAGSQGTIIVPTCTPREGYPKPTFDPILSPSEMGAFSEFFRKQPGVSRSHSPTHSVAAWGRRLDTLLDGHRNAGGRPSPWGEGAFGKGSPWDQLHALNAWWVMVSPDWEQSPFTAYIKTLFADIHSGITKYTPFPAFDEEQLGKELLRQGLLLQASWDGIPVIAFRLQETVNAALQILEQSPEVLSPCQEFLSWRDKIISIKQNGYLKAGTDKVKITPALPCSRWEGKKLTGVYRDLYARSVVFQDGVDRVAIVLCDLLGISADIVSRIRQKVHAEIGIPPEAIMISCTHSHSTPDTIGAGFEDPDYLEFLVDAISGSLRVAVDDLQPARIGLSKAPIRGLAQSRRKKLKDGRVFTTRYGVPSTWRVAPEFLAGEGAIDPELFVIRVENLEGEVLAGITNFGCHASVALVSPNLSGDFPGEAMAILEQILGEESVVLCTNGSAADVDPTLEMPYWGPRNDAMASHLGRIFAAQILESLERVEVHDLASIGFAQEKVPLDVRQDWIELLEIEQERMQQEFNTGWQVSPVIAKTLEKRKILTEVQALRLGEAVLVGFPGEVFAETGLSLKDSYGDRNVAVVELANDNLGYLVTEKICGEGGYETAQHLWGRVTPQGTQSLVETARRMIRKLNEPEPQNSAVGQANQ